MLNYSVAELRLSKKIQLSLTYILTEYNIGGMACSRTALMLAH